MVKKENHTALIYEFNKCTDPNGLKEGDDGYACESATAIKEFLEHKTVHMRVINDKIDFSKFDEVSIR